MPPASGGFAPKTPQPPAAGGLAPQAPLASGGWGAMPPDPPKTAPHCGFLATRLASAVMRALHYSVGMKQELLKKAKLSIFKTVFVPILTFGHELLWVMIERVRSQVQEFAMRFSRRIKGIALLNKVRSSEYTLGNSSRPSLWRHFKVFALSLEAQIFGLGFETYQVLENDLCSAPRQVYFLIGWKITKQKII